jgi:hypothetical protein
MAQRGRRSAASLAVVATLPGQRPEPPVDLTPAQAQVWRAVASTKPADWFTADSHPLLAAYCRHVVAADRIARLIDNLEAEERPDLGEYNHLLKMRDRESRAMVGLARSMRLTQQSRYDHKTGHTAATRVGEARKPWEMTG